MNLVWFLTIIICFSLILGEFGRYPFGGGGLSITLTDVFLAAASFFLIIWQIGIKKNTGCFSSLKYLAIFWLISIFSLLVNINFKGSFYLLRFILYSSSVLLGFSLIQSKVVNFSKFNNLIILVGVTLSILGFIQLLVFPNITPLARFGFDPHTDRLVSSFLDPNFLGAFLNICLAVNFLCLVKNYQKKYLVSAAIIFLAIILTLSRSAYLFLLIQFLVWAIFKFRKILVIPLILIPLILLFLPNVSDRVIGGFKVDKSARERFISWDNGFKVFKAYPVFGVGFNNLREVFIKSNLVKTYSIDGGHAGAGVDSSLLFVLDTTGMIGLIGYLSWWVLIFFKGFADKLTTLVIRGLIVGLLINSQFINSLFFPSIMFLIYFWLGTLWAANESSRSL